jgi:hypothetical protein
MQGDNTPDLLIFGDSHTAALELAMRQEGFGTALLYINGNHWHAGGFVYDSASGLNRPGSAFIRRRIARARVEMGGTLFRDDRVVLASVGYHLGRLCPGMKRRGHTIEEAAFDANPDASFLSQGMLEAMVIAQRQPLWDMLAGISKDCVLVVVAPPILNDDPLTARVAAFITRSLRERNIMVWDPREQEGPLGQPLASEMRSPDGVHGNVLYGRAVLDQIFPPTDAPEDGIHHAIEPAA